MPFHIISILIILTLFTLLLFATAFWIWMLVDCLLNKSLRDTQQVLWFLLILFTHIPGAIVYFFIGRVKKYMVNQPYQRVFVQGSQPRQPYSQGYQAQQASSQEGIRPVPPVQPPYEEQYEQPRATYPELPPQEAR